MTLDDARLTLQNSPWYCQLPNNMAEKLISNASVMPFHQGDVIHWQFDDSCALYCVLQGAIKVSSCSWEGKEAVLTYLPPGAWFGEIALFDGQTRTHTSQAHENSVLLKVSKNDVMQLIGQHPAFYQHMITLLCEKVRLLMAVVEESSLQTLPVRLAQRLMMLAESFGVETEKGVEIQLRLPQEELGQMLGISRQSVNKLLKQFEQNEWIEVAYRRIVLTRKMQQAHQAGLSKH